MGAGRFNSKIRYLISLAKFTTCTYALSRDLRWWHNGITTFLESQTHICFLLTTELLLGYNDD